MMKVNTPSWWKEYEQMEAKTAYGHTVMIPKFMATGGEMERLEQDFCSKREMNPLDGLENLRENEVAYEMVQVFWEIYQG